jgi:hypothetical protein
VIAFAPPLDQTPTLPPIVLVGTLVTVEEPRTVKLCKSGSSNDAADAGEIPHKRAAIGPSNTIEVVDLRRFRFLLTVFIGFIVHLRLLFDIAL